MAELATIARPYAEALFKATSADLNGASVWVDALSAIAQNPQLQQFADSPKATTDQVFDLIFGPQMRWCIAPSRLMELLWQTWQQRWKSDLGASLICLLYCSPS